VVCLARNRSVASEPKRGSVEGNMGYSEKHHVFVTGAAGFIGGYVVEEFIQNNWIVSALVHNTISSKLEHWIQEQKVIAIKGDATDKASLREAIEESSRSVNRVPDVIVHCAGRATDVGRRKEFRRTNFDSVRFLGKLVLEKEIERMVFVSTTDVYGVRDFHHEREEDLPLENNTGNPYPEYNELYAPCSFYVYPILGFILHITKLINLEIRTTETSILTGWE
jgi:nucleoside-diphosphate-sugar epimerase